MYAPFLVQVVKRWFLKGITGEPAYPGDVPRKVSKQKWLGEEQWPVGENRGGASAAGLPALQ